MVESLLKEDLDALCALDKLCFEKPWTRHALAEESGLGIKGAGGLLLAAILTRKIADERWVFRIMTHPDYRRQGLALKLLEVFQEESLWLEVSVNNLGAIQFYEQAGFKIIGRRPNYYPEDALLAMKEAGPAHLKSFQAVNTEMNR